MTDHLVIERTFVGAPERVYLALKDIDLLEHWLPPHPDMDAEITVVAEPGGVWRMHVPGELTFEGNFVDFELDTFVEYTWHATAITGRWAGVAARDEAAPASVVRIDLTPTEAGTALRLEHAGLDVDAPDEVAAIWDRCLGRLASII